MNLRLPSDPAFAANIASSWPKVEPKLEERGRRGISTYYQLQCTECHMAGRAEPSHGERR